MNYETLDWKAEAKRVTLAFGVKVECYFECEEFHEAMWLRPLPHYGDDVNLTIIEDLELGVQYFEKTLWFSVSNGCTGIEIDMCGNPQIVNGPLENAIILAKGLYHLGLLNPEVEDALEVAISAHQKLEWVLEYEARIKELQ